MTSRAAILPSTGDPLLGNLWLKCYVNNVASDIDKLYVRMTYPVDANARNFLADKFRDLGSEVSLSNSIETHGRVMKFLVDQVQEDHILFLEDDLFVVNAGEIGPIFKVIEDGQCDCIGSSRGCCSPEVVRSIVQAFNLTGSSQEHELKDCPNVWPCLFFAKTKALLDTDGEYGNRDWPQGTTIPLINHYCEVEECSDSFVWTTIQLRAQGCTFKYIHQNHTAPDDLNMFVNKTGLYALDPIPWVHIGSLSSGIEKLIKDKDNVPLGAIGTSPLPYPEVTESSVLELSRRVAMFQFAATYGKLEDPRLDYYNDKYAEGVERGIKEMGLPRDKIAQFYETMKFIFSSTLGI